MATVRKEVRLPRSAAEVWDALKDFGALHTRLVRGFVTNTEIQPDGARVVTFANGMQVREVLITSDDVGKRLVYAIKDSPAYTHYSASAQVFEDGHGSRFVWTVDFLPDSMAVQQDAAMEAGAAAIRATLA